MDVKGPKMKIFIDSRCDEITKAVARELGAKVVRDLECREPWRYRGEAVVFCGEDEKCPQASWVVRIYQRSDGVRLAIVRRESRDYEAFEELVWRLAKLVQGDRLAETLGEACAKKLVRQAAVVARKFVTAQLEQGSYVVVDVDGSLYMDGEFCDRTRLQAALGC